MKPSVLVRELRDPPAVISFPLVVRLAHAPQYQVLDTFLSFYVFFVRSGRGSPNHLWPLLNEVAIICALPLEYDAISYIFDGFWDENGDQYGRAAGDPNSYTNGRVGKYNAVLALLPRSP